MDKRYYYLLILLILVACKTKINDYPHKYHKSNSMKTCTSHKFLIHEDIIINELRDKIPFSGTVSHHLLVGDIIDKWFNNLHHLRDNINCFIIVSPKHFNLGCNNICLSSLDWQIDNKFIKVNKKHIKRIKKKLKIDEDRYAFHKEHGISTLLPFIKKYYPGAKIVPIVLDEFNKQIGKTLQLSEEIYKIVKKNKNTFVLISIDFSHWADRPVTDERDKKSSNIILNLNMEKINSIYSDNNTGLILLFDLCNKSNIKKSHIFCHTDSEKFSRIKQENDITSYFFTFQYY